MNKIKNILIIIYNYIKNHFKHIIYIIIIITLLKILIDHAIIYNITKEDNLKDQIITVYGITLQNITIIITIFTIPIGALWAFYQFKKTKKLKQQQRAAEIAQSFSTNIIPRIEVILNIFNIFKYNDKLFSNLILKKDLRFNIFELEKLFDKKIIESFNEFCDNQDTDEIYKKFLNDNYAKSQTEKFPLKFGILLLNVLNDLECLCINISSNAAGSSFIYNSMQTVFLQCVQQVYILIDYSNSANVDVCFTNVIYVYNFWYEQKTKEQEILLKRKKKISKIQDKASKEIEKLNYKKPETV